MKKALTGLRAWLVQRVTAVTMLLFLVFLFAHFLLNPPNGYAAWRAWVLNPGVSMAVLVFFAALLAHAWVGLRDVVLDYAKPLALRLWLLALLSLGLIGIATWVMRILWLASH